MSDNVLSLHGGNVCVTAGEPNDRIVALLEERLAQAKAGRIRALAVALVIEDGSDRPVTDANCIWDSGRFRDLYFAFGRLSARFNRECE